MMTREEAIAFYDSEQWKTMSLEDVANVPFSLFHEATEKLLGRSVWSHEFARPELLRVETRRPSQILCYCWVSC